VICRSIKSPGQRVFAEQNDMKSLSKIGGILADNFREEKRERNSSAALVAWQQRQVSLRRANRSR
jgi:hypothetical protein